MCGHFSCGLSKYILGFVLASLMLFSLSQLVFAEDETYNEIKTMNDYRYTIKEDNTIEILEYTGSSENISIPETIENKNVTSIGDCAFAGFSSIEIVYMPDTVLTIGDSAFSGCTSLHTVYLSEMLQTIGDSAFCGCTALADISFPEVLVEIGSYAFSGCENISSVTFYENLTSIGDYAFLGCYALADIQVYDSNLFIGSYAFEGTEWLSDMDAEWIILSDTVLVKYNGSDTDVIVPSEIESISSSAFADNSDIQNVDFSSSAVEYIGSKAFENCTSLKTVILNDKISIINSKTFYNCSSLVDIELSESLTEVCNYAFAGCTSLETINIPSGVAQISNYAFSGCTALISVTFNDGLEVISSYAFENCTSLGIVEIPESVQTVETMAFSNCISLTRVCFLGDITIESDAFDSCDNIEEAVFESDNVQIDTSAFDSTIMKIYCDITNTSSDIIDYANQKGFETLSLSTLPDYESKGVFAIEEDEDSGFYASYTVIMIAIIIVDIAIVSLFSIYILLFSRKKRKAERT